MLDFTIGGSESGRSPVAKRILVCFEVKNIKDILRYKTKKFTPEKTLTAERPTITL